MTSSSSATTATRACIIDRRQAYLARVRLIQALLLSILLASPAYGAGVSGQIENWSEDARYEVWRTTSLDLSRPDQPRSRVVVSDPEGNFELNWQEDGEPSWIILHQQVRPIGGPPLDVFRPADLLPLKPSANEEILLHGIDPALIWERSRASLRPEVLRKTILLALLVLGLGLIIRLTLRSSASPEGLRSAPLYELPKAPRTSSFERRTMLALLAVAAALRLRGIASQSLDLLELSYLPGIGRPVISPGAAEGLSGLAAMLEEFSALYCLDLVHPPLYHFLLGLFSLASDTEWVLRMPALLASLATTWLIWKLMRSWSTHVGLAAAGLHAVAPPAIYFGQDATPYALVGLIGTGSVLLLLRALRNGTTRAWTAWFAVIVLGFLCHYGIALVGIAELAAVGLITVISTDTRRWRAALHRASGPGLLFAPIPLLWAWLHFSTFPTVAQDTRLVADTYAQAPGLLPFIWDFFCVTSGLNAGGSLLPALAAVALLALGLSRAIRLKPAGTPGARFSEYVPGILLWLLLAAFFFNVALFYVNIRAQLGGRIFYGFRWLSWFHPLLLALIAMGAISSSAHTTVRVALSLIWLSGLLPTTVTQLQQPPRPDYEGAAEFIRSELADRDGLASLPSWFQRGNLTHYLKEGGIPSERHSREGQGVWMLDGKRINLEAVHSSLPFESSAANGHIDRLWVAHINESMFGRAKFSNEVALQAIAWADEHMQPDGSWEFRGLRLHRYRHKGGGEQSLTGGAALLVSSERAVLTHHSYPLLDDQPRFAPAAAMTGLPEGLGATVRMHSPMAPSCVEWDWSELQADLDPDASHHWYLELRIPFAQGQQPSIIKRSPAQLDASVEGNTLRVSAVGPSCERPPLQLLFLPPEDGAAPKR